MFFVGPFLFVFKVFFCFDVMLLKNEDVFWGILEICSALYVQSTKKREKKVKQKIPKSLIKSE